MHISGSGGAAERLKDQQAAQLQAIQNAASAASTASTGATSTGATSTGATSTGSPSGTDPFPSLLQARPAASAGQASSASPESLSALLAAQEQNGANDLAGSLSALDKLLSGVTGTAAASAPALSATA